MIGKATRKAVNEFIAQIVPLIPAADDKRFTTQEPTESPIRFDEITGIDALRKMTCVVLLPETHLAGILSANLPSPSAETALTAELLKAGLKIKDDARLAQLREERWVREAASGKLDEAKLADLRNRFGADVLIVGEGIAERNEKDQLNVSSVFCTGRVSVKAIRMDTGEILAVDSARAPGRDLSESNASKSALADPPLLLNWQPPPLAEVGRAVGERHRARRGGR